MSRAIRKPLMEKRRRARMNDSLETLKHILLESSTNHVSRHPSTVSKMDKADILELTVQFIQELLQKTNSSAASSEPSDVWRPW
ncbi:hairy [Carabus blaptoides fortunei]